MLKTKQTKFGIQVKNIKKTGIASMTLLVY